MFRRFSLRFSWHSLTASLLLAAGLLLRLRAYFSGRSLWLDEAMLVLNLLRRSFGGLMQPLDYQQGAPLGFLFLQKGLILLLGEGELVLRLVPLLAGCLALLLFARLAFQLLPIAGALTALALFAVSPTLVYYSSEAKQYALDVLLALWVWQGFRGSPLRPQKNFTWALTLAQAFLLPFFSHPVIFVLAGVTLAGFWLRRQERAAWFWLGAAAALGFGAAYALNLRALAQNTFLLAFWQETFPPLDGRFFSWLMRALAGLLGRFASAGLGLNVTPDWFNLLLFALGLGWLALQRRWQDLSGFVLPAVFTLAAAALGKYPFGGRLVLFLLPWAALVLGAAVQAWGKMLLRWGRGLSVAGMLLLAAILLFGPGQLSLERGLSPFMRENLHPALRALQAQRRPDDFLYIYPASLPAFLYYAPQYGFEQFLAGEYTQGQPLVEQALTDLQGVSASRLWILFSHVQEMEGVNERERILAGLDALWRCKINTRTPGTGVILNLCTRR